MLQKIRYFLFLIAVLVLVVVAFQNQQKVDIKLLFFSRQYSLTLLLLACSAVSFLLGSVWKAWRSRKREKAKHRQKSQVNSKTETPNPASAANETPDAVEEMRGNGN